MYEDIIKASEDLANKRQEEESKLQQEDRMLEQTDLINKTNVEVAKQLVKFMHEYLTSVEVNNMPEDLAKTDDIKMMVDKMEKLITVNSTNSGNFVKSLNTGINDLVAAIEKLNETSSDKSNESEYYDQICQDIRTVQKAIVDANKAVLTNDKTKDVISSLKNLEKAVKGLKLTPTIQVAPTPVDLKGIEKAIAEIPSKIVIPETVIPEQDNSAVLSAINQTTEAIRNIIFPVAEFPTTVKVTNPDGSNIGESSFTERYDYDETNIIYVGSADVGTATSSKGWIITKYDLSDSNNASGKVATDVSWDNRTTGTYA